jgi:hypothetical protein
MCFDVLSPPQTIDGSLLFVDVPPPPQTVDGSLSCFSFVNASSNIIW